MDRKLKKLLKGAGLERLVGGSSYIPDLNAYKKYGELKKFKGREGETHLSTSDQPNTGNGNIADYQFWYDRIGEGQRDFINKFGFGTVDIVVDRHRNQTPEEFEKTKATLKADLLDTTEPANDGTKKRNKKDDRRLLRDQWFLTKLEELPFWKSAEKFIAKDTVYRQPLMGQDEWAADVKRNIDNWKQRVDDAVDPATKADFISQFSEYQNRNASYDTYVANENAKPAPPSFEGKENAVITKAIGEEDVQFDKRSKLDQLRMANDYTSHDVAEKIKTLNGMKTGNLIADEEIEKTLAYIKYGEYLREQIAKLEREGAEKDMTLADYYESIGSPELIDVESKVAEENKKIDDAIERYKHSGAFVWDQFKKWGMLVIDIGSNFLPYILPFPIGNVIQLGYQAFAPPGSIYHTEGNFGEKMTNLALNGAEQAVLGAIGLGRKRRKNRKYMAELMEAEEGGASESARSSEPCSRSRSSRHAKSRPRTQK